MQVPVLAGVVDYLAQQQATAIAQAWVVAAKLVPGIDHGARLGGAPQLVSGEDLRKHLAVGFAWLQIEQRHGGRAGDDQARLGNRLGQYVGRERVAEAGKTVVELQLDKRLHGQAPAGQVQPGSGEVAARTSGPGGKLLWVDCRRRCGRWQLPLLRIGRRSGCHHLPAGQVEFLAVQVLYHHLDLVEGHFYVVFPEGQRDTRKDLVGGGVAVAQFAHVETQLVVEGAGADGQEEQQRLWIAQYARVLDGGLHHQFARQRQVGFIGHTDLHDDPGNRVVERPIDQLVGDEGLVRHDDFFAVEIGDGGGANADLADRAGQVADGHHVADAHRALEQDDQAGDKIGEDLLQAEAEAHRQRGYQPLQLVPADAEGRQSGDKANGHDQVGQQGGGGVGAALGQLQP